MDYHELLRAWASPLISAAALGYAIVTGRGKAAKEEQGRLQGRIEAVEASQRDVKANLTKVEMTVQHLPTAKQFTDMQLAFAQMSGDMKVLTSTLDRIEKRMEKAG